MKMSTDAVDAPSSPRPAPRGHPLIAWAVILLVVVGLFVLRLVYHPAAGEEEFDSFELQARALVGAASLGPQTPEIYSAQVKELDRGSVGQRLRFVVLAGELAGPTEALAHLEALHHLESRGAVAHKVEDDATGEILGRLYYDYEMDAFSAPALSDADRQHLQRQLGWFGDLALNPRDGPDPAARAAVLAPAQRLVVVFGGALVVGLFAGALGFTLLVLFAVLWRHMRSRFAVGSPYGGVYAETFALWLILYVGFVWLIRRFAPSMPLALEAGLPQFSSLIVLAWPVLRGVSWRQVRQDIGWRADQPMREPFYGVLCYLAALPIVIVVMLIVVLVIQHGPKWITPPTHPIAGDVLHSDWWGWLQILFVASVGAPFVEETMFRGVLYRHLREATAVRGRWRSVVVSALIAAFIFAALHPQGWLGIPPLMALACGFTAAREWRASLVPSMTVHALHNGALLLMLILATG
jgi:membrane protease YdiL (CAAX protease family)